MKLRYGVAIAALLLCLSCLPAHAGPEMYVMGGMCLANLGGDAELFGQDLADGLSSEIGGVWTAEKKMRMAYDFGVGLGYEASESVLGGAIEAHYVSRGTKWNLTEVSATGVQVKTTFKLDYVEIPFLAQVSPQTGGRARPVFLLGPVLGIRASSSLKAEGPGGSVSTDVSEGMKSTYFGGLVGAGLKVRTATRSSFLVQARYQLGLSNVIDDPDISFKPQDFSFLIGYSFGI
jgi:hypothetical protein